MLRTEATIQLERVDQLVAGNPEHRTMIGQLEQLYDQATGTTIDPVTGGAIDPVAGATIGPVGEARSPMSSDPIPSADELAAEFERFLRDQTD
ncbi:MAG: hypothetical protein FD127_1293 [Acidimicrobiaceae bacterium]|nr:MAG: hypothetical protein FD127_1293 [Acidimicrobiaceae bacterium]